MKKIVFLVCSIHIWWGLSLIVGIVLPRPFGALEPFFLLPFSNDLIVGFLLLFVGILPLTYNLWPSKVWCLACLMVPQQMVLAWGLVIGIIDILITHDGRTWYALGYTGPIFMFHAFEMKKDFEIEMIKWRS